MVGQYGLALLPDAPFSLLLMPEDALVERAGIRCVFVLDEDHRVHLRSVRLGKQYPQTYQLLAGIEAGERGILNPSNALRKAQYGRRMNPGITNLPARLAHYFVDSRLTLVMALVLLVAGFIGLAYTPREENPQISVPGAEVTVTLPGAGPEEVEHRLLAPVRVYDHALRLKLPDAVMIKEHT